MADLSLLDRLPPERGDVTPADVRAAVLASGRKIVALDDDPTGVQTVHEVAVLARWPVDALAAELKAAPPLFFLLTNSRSLAADDAAELNRGIARDLVLAAEETGVEFAVASRSDSTLRGHFPAETDALAAELGRIDGVVVCPAFFEGGRYTIDDVHYVRQGDRLTPAAETEFARDAAFSYRSSNLRDWVAEKSGGRIAAADVASVSIEDARIGGVQRVAQTLAALRDGRPVVINAAGYADLHVAALALLQIEAAGKRFLYRTGASFVRARAGIAERAQLTRTELLGGQAPPRVPGLVVVGSHVRRSGEQLAELVPLPGVVPIEVSVAEILVGGAVRDRQVRDAAQAVEAALRQGFTPVVSTSRHVETATAAEGQLALSRSVSAALVAIVSGVETRPGFIVAKGGITSSDIGTEALGVRRAVVLGQIRPGIPVWRLGPETRFPLLPYVVFPGNVGEAGTLAEIVRELRGNG